ncbi:MAG TPA: right-handed parallel beta-helix repeat-containing protein [Solirubrobacteraceae bacterium]
MKLTANMICRTSDRLDVGRSGITVNLNGHTIKAPGGPSSYDGIYNDGYGRVTIENGTIRNFEDGIFEQATHGSKILEATVHGSGEAGIPLRVLTGRRHQARRRLRHPARHLSLRNFAVNVSDSVANHNLIYGLYDYVSAATVSRVTASSNDDYGFYVEYPVADTTLGPYTIENSTASDNSYAGFYVYNNAPPHSAYQADLFGNRADDNADYGFYAEYWAKGRQNHATGNSVSNCYRPPRCG